MSIDVFLVTPAARERENGNPIVDYVDANVPRQDPPILGMHFWPPMDSKGRPTNAVCVSVWQNIPLDHAKAASQIDGVRWLRVDSTTTETLQDHKATVEEALTYFGLPTDLLTDTTTNGQVLNNVLQNVNPNSPRFFPE